MLLSSKNKNRAEKSIFYTKLPLWKSIEVRASAFVESSLEVITSVDSFVQSHNDFQTHQSKQKVEPLSVIFLAYYLSK